jgi:hypothetical protein
MSFAGWKKVTTDALGNDYPLDFNQFKKMMGIFFLGIN